MLHSARRRDEEGLAASALLVTGLLVGLAMFAFWAVPFTTAIDAKAKNRTAADAAAIAGAEGVREDLLTSIAADGVPGAWTGLPGIAGLGRYPAEEYAALNDATLVSYYFDATDGTAHVQVRGRGVDGEASRSSAVAQVDLPECEELEPPPLDDPVPDGPPGPDGPPSGPPTDPLDVSVDCGSFALDFQVRYTEDGGIEILMPPGQVAKVRDEMDVRLVD